MATGHKNSLDGFHAGQWLNGLYALAHGYHYCVFTKRLRPDTRKPHWHKVLAVQHTLKVCRNVVLLDSDAAIHDFDLRLEPVFDEFLGAGTGKHMALAVDWPQPWCYANTGGQARVHVCMCACVYACSSVSCFSQRQHSCSSDEDAGG